MNALDGTSVEVLEISTEEVSTLTTSDIVGLRVGVRLVHIMAKFKILMASVKSLELDKSLSTNHRPAVCLVSATITESTSNNATTTLVVPLLIQIVNTMRVQPLLLMIPGAIGTQFAFLLTTGTPSNVVGFSTGHIDIQDMIKTGLPLKIAGTAVKICA
ncbi:hypothetical protein RJ639_035154 [Escallonia herrerae]|uniref:Uncharacterized protein n=1 Tax=Escallonia herrerae TaxID=1293975 RepID=A0AA88WY48_9ASTE|nr:hypothetical protein RJ639_035154 [Escallonia herrerae]